MGRRCMNDKSFYMRDAFSAITENRIDEFISMVRCRRLSINSFVDGKQPIHEVCIYGYEDFLKYLIDNGADLNVPNRKNRTPIIICIKFRNWECLKILLTRGALYSIEIRKWIETKKNCGEIREQISRIMSEILWERRKGIIYYYYLQNKAMLPLAIFRELVSFI